ncbi:unnamed protein product [Calypogeia fissa]
MYGMARYFLKHFMEQARYLLESLSLVNIKAFTPTTHVIDKVDALYQRHTEEGEENPEYAQFLVEAYISELFCDKEDNEITVVEAVRLLPAHIYRLPGMGTLTKKLVVEVAIQNQEHPRTSLLVKKSKSEARMGEEPSDPLPVGPPTPKGTPKGTPRGTPTREQGTPAM